MKVRVGISLGAAGEAAGFAAAVDQLESTGIDSLWLPENVYGAAVEPFTGMAFALARTRRLKAGSGISVLPGRHPVLVAKQLASLAGLAPGRVLPVFGLQPALAAERGLFPVPAGQRAAVFDEALTLLRLLLTTPSVSFAGAFFTVDGACVGPLPGRPLDIWLGGSAPAGLRRVGRLADGWLGSLLTPAEAASAVGVIQDAAAEAGREVDPDHFGISLPVAFDGVPAALASSIARRRPGMAPESLVADGWAGARRLIRAYVEAGLSKFVVRAAAPVGSFEAFIADFAAELLPLQTLSQGAVSPVARHGPGVRFPLVSSAGGWLTGNRDG
jgi:probable F420-dependent oxidoreductase